MENVLKYRAEAWNTKERVVGQFLSVPSYTGSKSYIIKFIVSQKGDKVTLKEKRIRVIPYTVELCTGIKDSDGVELYENDLVNIKFKDDPEIHLFIICYDCDSLDGWVFNEHYITKYSFKELLAKNIEFIKIKNDDD